MMSLQVFSLGVLMLVTFTWFLNHVVGVKRDQNEPQYISPKVPIIGHAIGLLQKKYDYYISLSKKYKLRIFGLAMPGMPGGRVYVINSAELVLAVQRVPKKLSFWDVEATFAVKMAGLDANAAKLMMHNASGVEEGESFFAEGMVDLQKQLKPSEKLTDITREAAKILACSIGALEEQGAKRVDLGAWVVQEIMASVTTSYYGPKNPFKDPEAAQAFLDFEHYAVELMSFPLPQITCSKGYKAREKLVSAFVKYYEDGGRAGASHIHESASKVRDAYEVSNVDRSRFDAVNGHAILANTTPTAFWTIYHVLSDPAILKEVRAAVEPLVSKSKDGSLTYEIDISHIRDIPILKSVLHEALRHYAGGTGTRIVLEDTMLDGKYLLKKGSFIFMPNQAYHFDEESWGSDVDEFDAHRFMKPKPHLPGAFRGFGGGVNLCPGRFFAMNENLAMCAMLVMRYDIKPVGGTWRHPGVDRSNLSLLVNPPKDRVLVEIVPRKGWEGGSWSFKL
ncbi:cytochrome p450 protein [Rutstroemia sp. NJR-2017a BBW]|nr:cytochrome p450 protein [Rutstroemia sp. NJR-2017a BBW]